MASTRYVWEKYSVGETTAGWGTETSPTGVGSPSHSGVVGRPTTDWVGCTVEPTLDENGYFIPRGQTITSGIWDGASAIRQSTYNYFIVNDSNSNRRKYYYDLHSNAAQWFVQNDPSGGNGYVDLFMISSQTQKLGFYVVSAVPRTIPAKGDYIGLVSSANPSAYPNDGESGSFYYEYIGSDTIDPTSVYLSSYSQPGSPAIAKINVPSNSLGGTVSYIYQYQVNGGNWTTFATTSDTSQTFTIPSNAASLRLRVQSKDDLGFTSTTYIYSETYTFETFKAYIGINNVARKVSKIYIGINGKARLVTKGYIGVNGKARRFL